MENWVYKLPPSTAYRRVLKDEGADRSPSFSTTEANNVQQERADSHGFSQTTFDTNIVIITAALLFVLMSALGMNALIRCVLSWTRRLATHQAPDGSHSFRCKPTAGINKAELKLLPTSIYHNKQPSTEEKDNHCSHSHLAQQGCNRLMQAEDHDQVSQTHEDSQCPICLSEFQDGDKIRVLPLCSHGFHMSCVDAWLVNHSSCPTCRADPINNHSTLHADALMKKSTQVQLEILISPAGTLTPTVYRVSSMS